MDPNRVSGQKRSRRGTQRFAWEESGEPLRWGSAEWEVVRVEFEGEVVVLVVERTAE